MLLGHFTAENAARTQTETRTVTYDVKSYSNYKNFTSANFAAVPATCGTDSWGESDAKRSGGEVQDPSISYNASTGTLTVTGYFGGVSQRNFGYGYVYVYLYYTN